MVIKIFYCYYHKYMYFSFIQLSFAFFLSNSRRQLLRVHLSVSINNGSCLAILRSFPEQIVASTKTSFTSLELDQFSCSSTFLRLQTWSILNIAIALNKKTKNYTIYIKKIHVRKSCFYVKNTLKYLWSAKKVNKCHQNNKNDRL